ncbi:MAG: hypothetical protein IIZ10_06830 [Solobacterium sp.]|nr:hypothetical protein [Solobacterium sp.]
MKKIFAGILTAALLAGCGNASLLEKNLSAVSVGVGSKLLSGSGSPISAKTEALLPAVNSTVSAGRYTGEGEVAPSDFAEFMTFYSDGIPSDAAYPALRYAEGSWKYYLDMQDADTGGVRFNELGLADLSLNRQKETVIITLHPRMAGDGYELYPETDEEVGYEPFEGGLDDRGALKLAGNDVILYITAYFAWSGREYVMGETWYSEESCGLFLLTRGQQ